MKTKKSFLFQKVTASVSNSDAPVRERNLPPSEDATDQVDTPFPALAFDTASIGCAVVPAEVVSIHAVDLPVKSARQRVAALPFALEDAIACPLEQTHFALLHHSFNGMTLAATIEIAVLEKYIDNAPDSVLIPEQMLISAPGPDTDGHMVWRVYRHAERALVRASDGTGFALHADMLGHVWQAAGKPRIDSFGAALPDTVQWTDLSAQPVPQPIALLTADLRQGMFQPDRGFARPLKVLAACVAIAGIFQLGVAVLDVRAQRAIADGLRAEAARALMPLLPNASPDDAPTLLQRQLAALSAPQRGSAFLPLMDRVAEALIPLSDRVQFRQLNWQGDILRLSVEAADLSALQRAEASLQGNGLIITVGSASMDGGAARAELTVRP